MEDLRIMANSLDQKSEIITMLIDIGYKRDLFLSCDSDDLMGIHVYSSGEIQDVIDKDYNDKRHKEITIQQLRDLVVLKRNDVNDATHTCDGHKYYLTTSEFFEYINGYWENVDEYVDGCIFEPIEKEMKEYLKQLKNGGYELSNDALCSEGDFSNYAKLHNIPVAWQFSETENTKQPTGIEATLAERQATYGCFEDVARTTEQIMEALGDHRVNGLHDLPYPHRMALYMIASKMARIVNGDFNSIDGWHDIAGYATLIERLIGGDNV